MSQQWPDPISFASRCRRNSGIVVRDMTDGDIAAGLRLCRLSGWNQLANDWELFLKLSPGGCRVAQKDGKVVGTVATLRYQDRFSWLSMLLVDPAERGAGIGTRLLKEGLRLLENQACVRLDATPLGKPIYERHGFLEENTLSRMTAPAGNHNLLPEPERARPMCEKDLPAVLARDLEVFGADRQVLLRRWFELAPECAWVIEGADCEGYCFGRPGFKYQQLGPIVANDETIAAELVAACLRRLGNTAVAIDAPVASAAWMERLAALGFKEERPFARMRRGIHQMPRAGKNVFGIAGPEFG